MSFLEKVWRNLPSRTTELSAEALNDLEARIAEGLDFESGVYTPTAVASSFPGGSNAGTLTPQQCSFLRVGNVVTVSGRVIIDPAAAGQIAVQLSLPIPSDFGSVNDAGGAASNIQVVAAYGIFADIAANAVVLQGVAADGTNRSAYLTFTYRIL